MVLTTARDCKVLVLFFNELQQQTDRQFSAIDDKDNSGGRGGSWFPVDFIMNGFVYLLHSELKTM